MFSDLIGNDEVKSLFRRLMAAERVPNSLLFAGGDGIGKKHFALELARSVICPASNDLGSCGKCSACVRSAKFTFPKSDDRDAHKKVIFSDHPDVGTVIPYNKNILVDAIRELEREAYFRPYEAKARFFIIDDADKMNDSASNALLKTLEEPASSSHIILISSRPDSLLQTIRSRCQMIRFAPVETHAVESFLAETKKFSVDDAALAAKLSGGSVGKALSMNIDAFRTQREMMLVVVSATLVRTDRALLLQTAEKMNDAKNKDAFEENLDILLSLIRDVWTLRLGGGNIVNADIEPKLRDLAEYADAAKLAGWMNDIELMRETFAVNINKKVATDALFMQMAG